LALLNYKGFEPLFFSGKLRRQLALCYHDIGIPLDSNLHQVAPDVFRQQIQSLIERGYQFLSADDFLLSKRFKGLRKLACITFDDGYKSILIEAAPILKEFGVPGTLFLNTRLLDGKIFWRDKVRTLISHYLVSDFKQYLTIHDSTLADKIDFENFYLSTKANKVNSKALEKSLNDYFLDNGLPLEDSSLYLNESELNELLTFNFSIGNHTENHYRLSSLSDQEKKDEIYQNKLRIKSLNLPEAKTFAIPFGENRSFDQLDIKILKEQGYKAFFMTNQGHREMNVAQLEIRPLGLAYSNRILPPNENIFK